MNATVSNYPTFENFNPALLPISNLKSSLKMAQSIVGEPVTPSWGEVLKQWEKTVRFLPFSSPRTFLQIYDIRYSQALLSYGLSLIGYRDDYCLTAGEALELMHDNERSLFAYQLAMIYKVFLKRPELIHNKGLFYSTTRSLKKCGQKDAYWLIHQITKPIQYDVQGRMVRYMSFYRLIGAYKGEPFKTEIYTNSKYSNEQRQLRVILADIRKNMLAGLGFTRKQQEVAEYMSKGYTTNYILDIMGIQRKGLDKHRSGIIEIGKQLFPAKKFKTAYAVVLYLKKQELI